MVGLKRVKGLLLWLGFLLSSSRWLRFCPHHYNSKLATSAEIALTAARTGASTVPITATVTGISINVFPCSSLTMIRCTFPS